MATCMCHGLNDCPAEVNTVIERAVVRALESLTDQTLNLGYYPEIPEPFGDLLGDLMPDWEDQWTAMVKAKESEEAEQKDEAWIQVHWTKANGWHWICPEHGASLPYNEQTEEDQHDMTIIGAWHHCRKVHGEQLAHPSLALINPSRWDETIIQLRNQ